MITILSALASLLSFRVRGRASLEIELKRARDRPATSGYHSQAPAPLPPRLLSVAQPSAAPLLDTLILVKPATVIGWHRKGLMSANQNSQSPQFVCHKFVQHGRHPFG